MNGFIINAETYLQRFQQTEDETWFFGVLEDNRNFIWKERPALLKAYLPATTEIAPKYYHRKSTTPFFNYNGTALHLYTFSSFAQLKAAKRDFPKVSFLESELTSMTHFLIDHAIKGSVLFLSPPAQEDENLVIYENPKIKPSSFVPTLNSVSIDIETGVEDGLLYSIALYSDVIQKVLMLDPNNDLPPTSTIPVAPSNSPNSPTSTQNLTAAKDPNTQPITVISLQNEKTLLKTFLLEIKKLNPHIIMGWNIVGFDFSFLQKKYEEHNIPFTLGFNDQEVISYKKKTRDIIIKIPGRAFLEGMDIIKALAPPLPNYKLDTAAEILLTRHKTITATGKEKIQEIIRLFQTNKRELAEYNLKDTELVYVLIKKFAGISFQISRVLLTGVLLERLGSSAEIIHHMLLPLLKQKRIISSIDLFSTIAPTPQPTEGQNISSLQTGPVSTLKIEDLIPLTILYYKIDPYGMLAAKKNPKQAFHTPTGSSFHTTHHFMPVAIEILLKLIDQLPSTDTVNRKVLTFTMEQLIGGLSTPSSRFAFPNLKKALYDNVLHLVEKLTLALKKLGAEILYYDPTIILLKKNGLTLAKNTSTQHSSHIINEHKTFVKNLLQTANETILPKVFASIHRSPTLIDAACSAQLFIPNQPELPLKEKRTINYFAITETDEFNNHSRDYYRIKVLHEAETFFIKAYLKGDDILNAITTFKANLLAGNYDELLVQRKKLTKAPETYNTKAHLPPHIEAAQKLPDLMRDQSAFKKHIYIYYLITEAGGEPHGHTTKPIDYHHYWQNEITPVIKKLFQTTPFEEAIAKSTVTEDHELSLF
ncbi:DNA polymerase II [Spirochaetota bacterium]|nr:DNA polymerase II [Spirochaetota bacterium]